MQSNRRKTITTFIGLVCLVLIFFVPPLCPVHNNPVTGFWTEWIAGVLMLAGSAILFLGNRYEFQLPAATWLWIAWGVSLLLSVVTNHYDLWQPVIFTAVFWVTGLLALLFGAELVRRAGREQVLLIIAYTLLVAGVLQAIVGLLRYYGLLEHVSLYLEPLRGSRLQGLFNYPTLTGFSLWLSLCGTLYLLSRKRIGWTVFVLASVIMAIAIVATGNRSSILYWFCLALATVITVLRYRNAPLQGSGSLDANLLDTKRALMGMAAITLIVPLCIPAYGALDRSLSSYLSAQGYPTHRAQVHSLFDRKHDFWGIRFSAFHKAVILAEEAPLLGIGPGNYPYRSFLLNSTMKNSIREGTIETHSHNIFSMLLAENGILGVIILVVACGFLVRWWWKMPPSAEAMFTAAILMDFFAYSNIEYPLWYLNFLVIFMLFCGFVSPVRSGQLSLGFLKPATALVILIGGGAVAWETVVGYWDISSVTFNHVASPRQARTLEKWFSNPFWAAQAGVVFEQETIATRGDIADQLSLANQVIEFLPTPPALIHKVMLYQFSGQHDKACQLAEQVAGSYPHAANSFDLVVSWYETNPRANVGKLASLMDCFQKGVDDWVAQWK